MVAGKRRVELQGEITSAGAQLVKFFLLNQSSRDRVHGAGIYSIIREEGNEGKITQSGNFLPRFERYNERGKRVLMDSLGYTFFIPDVHTPLLPSPPFCNPPLCNQLEIQLPTHFSARRKKEERDTPGILLVLQFKVANSPLANLLLLL